MPGLEVLEDGVRKLNAGSPALPVEEFDLHNDSIIDEATKRPLPASRDGRFTLPLTAATTHQLTSDLTTGGCGDQPGVESAPPWQGVQVPAHEWDGGT